MVRGLMQIKARSQRKGRGGVAIGCVLCGSTIDGAVRRLALETAGKLSSVELMEAQIPLGGSV